MESPATVARYINQNSKKRVFLGGSSSSSSSACNDLEVLDMSPPPSNFASAKPRSSKEEEVLNHEIIDMEDVEAGSDDIADGLPKASAKGKEPLKESSDGDVGLENDELMNDIMSNTGGSLYSPNADDFNSSPFDGEDEWADSYHDEMLYDDYSAWESQFDHMDIPTGVEVQFPWFPSSSGNDTKVEGTSSSTPSSIEPQTNAGNYSTGPKSSESKMDLLQENLLNTLSEHIISHKKFDSLGDTSLYSQASKAMLNLKSAKQSSHALGKNKRNYRFMNSLYAGHNSASGAMSKNGGGYSVSDVPKTAPGYGTAWQDFSDTMLNSGFATAGFPSTGAFQPSTNHVNNQNCGLPPEPRNVEEIMQNYGSFKRFEIVEDFSDHHYHSNGYPAKQPPKNWARRIQEEWRVLEKDLPDKIFVRAYEVRMDLLRAVIIGAEGTPYHDGLFFFDLYFPSSYPNIPPNVYYHSGGLRINPNLYNCGKVCLSLLNTWSGSQKEKWIPGESTMLQVLVSIQGLILNAKPYFNEPGYADTKGSTFGDRRSLDYNESTFVYSLQTMVYKIRNPPKYFEDFVMGHFIKFGRDILMACKAYLDGAQVASVVKGDGEDVKEGEGDKCSQQFKANLVGYLSVVVPTFLQIGAKDCEEFIGLALRGNGIDGVTKPPPRDGKLCK